MAIRKIDDNRGMNALKHGGHSKVIASLQERLKMQPMKDAEKREYNTMLEQMNSLSWAFDFDRAIKSHLIDSINDTDKKLMSYVADLQNTQIRIAKTSKDMAFHQSTLEDLKQDYIDETDKLLKAEIYTRIAEVEKVLQSYEKLIADYIDKRNKIRKEIDKGKYQEKSLKLKEDAMGGINAKPIEADFSVMDDIQ